MGSDELPQLLLSKESPDNSCLTGIAESLGNWNTDGMSWAAGPVMDHHREIANI